MKPGSEHVRVTIQNDREDMFANDEIGIGLGEVWFDGEFLRLAERTEQQVYPFDQVIGFRGLARVAGRAMFAGQPEDIALARQIVDFFEENATQAEPSSPTVAPHYF